LRLIMMTATAYKTNRLLFWSMAHNELGLMQVKLCHNARKLGNLLGMETHTKSK